MRFVESNRIAIDDLAAMLQNPAPQDLLLDVRDEESAQWHPEGRAGLTYANIPFERFVENLEPALAEIPRDRRVAVLCYKGNSSQHVAGLLREHGIAAASVDGGMNAWAGFHRAVRIDGGEAFELWQIVRPAKGCMSYAIVSDGEAVIVDGSHYVEYYESFARSRRARIVRTFDTHLHADHISGNAKLAANSSAPYHLHDDDAVGASLDREPMPREFSVGSAKVKVVSLPVPGHTLGSTALLVDGRFLISGDTLLPSSVGRPDLGDAAREWAGYLHDSLVRVLRPLGDEVVVLPAHASSANDFDQSGSCLRPLGQLLHAQPLDDKERFLENVEQQLRGSHQPASYAHIRRINLGAHTTSEEIDSLEVGMNKCALSAVSS